MLPIQQQEKHDVLESTQENYTFHKLKKQKDF